MNWSAVKRHNALASARKAKRERAEAERKARIAREGGPVKVIELRSAASRIESKPQGLPGEIKVWTFRGRDWVIGYGGGNAFPYRAWRIEGCDPREAVPLTPGATKWYCSAIGFDPAFDPASAD